MIHHANNTAWTHNGEKVIRGKTKSATSNNRSYENKRSEHINQNRKQEHRISNRTAATRELQQGEAELHPIQGIPQNLTRHGYTVALTTLTPDHHLPIQSAPLNNHTTPTKRDDRGERESEGAHTARSACLPAFQYA